MCSGEGGESTVQLPIGLEMEDLPKPDMLMATHSCGATCAWSAPFSALNVSEGTANYSGGFQDAQRCGLTLVSRSSRFIKIRFTMKYDIVRFLFVLVY